jgi:ERCC4-type nuclease
MTILAECSHCDSVHPLGSRALSDESLSKTLCPNCESSTYHSRCTTETTTDDEIRSTLLSVDGVGPTTLDNIEATLGSLTAVQWTTASTLTDVDGVGSTVAERIERVV